MGQTLNRIEFLITNQCSSNCIHCSVKNHRSVNNVINLQTAKDILDSVIKEYKINSIMTFGGESLLYPETTTSLLKYAKDLEISNRQLITNCFWSKDKDRISERYVNY